MFYSIVLNHDNCYFNTQKTYHQMELLPRVQLIIGKV